MTGKALAARVDELEADLPGMAAAREMSRPQMRAWIDFVERHLAGVKPRHLHQHEMGLYIRLGYVREFQENAEDVGHMRRVMAPTLLGYRIASALEVLVSG